LRDNQHMPRTDEALDAILRSLLDEREASRPRPPGQPAASKRPLPSPPAAAATTVHRVKVTLAGARPPVWRRLEVPSSLPLSLLHEVLQTAFGWFDCYPHEFATPFGGFGDPAQDDFWSRRADESTATLAQVAAGARDKVGYVYDFGRNWRHAVVVEAIRPAAPGVRYPRCAAVRGTAPEEGCGGIAAFNSSSHNAPAPSPALITQQLAGWSSIMAPAEAAPAS
jgi:hypothetical protein